MNTAGWCKLPETRSCNVDNGCVRVFSSLHGVCDQTAKRKELSMCVTFSTWGSLRKWTFRMVLNRILHCCKIHDNKPLKYCKAVEVVRKRSALLLWETQTTHPAFRDTFHCFFPNKINHQTNQSETDKTQHMIRNTAHRSTTTWASCIELALYN